MRSRISDGRIWRRWMSAAALALAVAAAARAGADYVPYFPARGNHERASDTAYIVGTILPSHGDLVKGWTDRKNVNYYVDWKNVRFIFVDQYSDFGRGGDINEKGRAWVDGLIKSAGDLDHVFVMFHEPAFPRHRHHEDSLNANKKNRDAFWNMLVSHGDKVKAVFVGHTHAYYRMRVKDPATGDQDNRIKVSRTKPGDPGLPVEEGGIWQVDCGGRGSVIVQVNIDGPSVRFRALRNSKQGAYKLIDEWAIPSEQKSEWSGKPWAFACGADNRTAFGNYRRVLEECRDMTVNPAPKFSPIEFVAVAGDLDPVQKNYEEVFLKAFPRD